MARNIPDRIKLILQLVVFSLALWLPILFALALIRDQLPIADQPSMSSLRWGAFALSTLCQILRLLYHWRKILQQEKAGDLPDTQLLQNLDLVQTTLLLPGIVLLPLGCVLFTLISHLWGIACFLCVGLLWLVDRSYFIKKKKHLEKQRNCQPQP